MQTIKKNPSHLPTAIYYVQKTIERPLVLFRYLQPVTTVGYTIFVVAIPPNAWDIDCSSIWLDKHWVMDSYMLTTEQPSGLQNFAHNGYCHIGYH